MGFASMGENIKTNNMTQQTDHNGDGNKMVTAIDWLINWMGKSQYFIGNDLLQAIKQAKAMEKEQIMDAYRQGVTDEHGEVLDFSKDDSPQRYYNKNYGTE